MPTRPLAALAATVLSFAALAGAAPSRAAEQWAVFGSQRDGPGIGLSVAKFEEATGRFGPARLAVEARVPSFVAFSADGRTLYACHGTRDFAGQPGGAVGAFRFDPATGAIESLGAASSGGAGACFVGFDRSGKFLLTANYTGGNVAVFALEADGRIGARTALLAHTGSGPNADRQKSPHPHSIWAEPGNRFVLVPDLGADRVFVHRFDAATGALTADDAATLVLPPGTGPRHLAWGADGKFFYLLGELSGTLHVVAWDAATGAATIVQTESTLPVDHVGPNTAGEVKVSPDGRFVYATNRGHDSIAVFAIAPGTGRMEFVERGPSGGKFPRNLAFAGGGRWLLVNNHNSDSAAVFAVDRATGKLTPHGEPLAVPYPFGLALRAVEPAAK